jgi:hypothetical protein
MMPALVLHASIVGIDDTTDEVGVPSLKENNIAARRQC